MAGAGEREHRDLARDLPDPPDLLHGELSAIARPRPGPTPHIWTLGRSVEGIRRAAPSRRSSCLQAARSFAARVDALHAGSGACCRREVLLLRKSRPVSSRRMPALRDSEGALRRIRLEWKAGLSRSGGSTSACLARVVVFDFHGPRQPVENVRPVPADRLSAVSALLRESSEYREAEKQPARATGQARDLACAKYRAQVRKRFVDPPRQAKVLRCANDCRGDSGAFTSRSGIHALASST